ncbi:DUF6628 family protein [Sphingomonas sp. MMS24-J13]|uniref:DUF6628 family protein n=1 Tax=Sphingomonas sp. MMS24-J13 TaxID=3238686 RepID=UPI00384DA24F
MKSAIPAATLLPHPAPISPYARLLLYGIRRMAAGGIDDAHAAHAFFTGFGLGYRRPLILTRAFMAEVSRVSAIRLVVAPCCCPRTSEAENVLLNAVAGAVAHPQETHDALARLLHVRECLGLVTSAQAVAASFADQGMPLNDDCNFCKGDEAF